MPYLIDSHAHLNFNAYKDDAPQVIDRALSQDIWLVNVGSQYSTSKRAVSIANQYPSGIYAAIGIHPIHLFETQVDEEEDSFATRQEQFDSSKYQVLINNDKLKKIVAIGEIGLDYYHIPKNYTLKEVKETQAQNFLAQANFAHQNNLPLILHCRGSVDNPLDAYKDLIQLLSQLSYHVSGVIHCFSSTLEIAHNFLELGLYVGFTGIVTFGKNADSLREVVKDVPLDKILIETDCPYLAPAPHRGKRNEPSYVELIAARIAQIKNITLAELAQQTVTNTKQLYHIK